MSLLKGSSVAIFSLKIKNKTHAKIQFQCQTKEK